MRRFPFDPRRRRMSVVVGDRLLVKGAPDAVLVALQRRQSAPRDALDAMAERGPARARRRHPPGARRRRSTPTADDAEHDLELLGLLGLEDPPRPSAADAIAACRRAGIRVAMVTGDHPATAARDRR